MKKIIAIDPGNTHSAIVIMHEGGPTVWKKTTNGQILSWLRTWSTHYKEYEMAIETPAPRGMPTALEEMQTLIAIGEFKEAFRPGETHHILRKDVKMNLCGQVRAKDKNIRQALVDRFIQHFGVANEKELKGLKKNPGPLYKLAADMWQALAVGCTHYDSLIREGLR